MKELGCHAYATSRHKWLIGPKGTNLLYLSDEVKDTIRPMRFKESRSKYNDSNGVVNRAAILGLSKAIKYIQTVGIDKIEEHNMGLRNRLYEHLSKINSLKMMSPGAGPLASPILHASCPIKKWRRLHLLSHFINNHTDQHSSTSQAMVQWHPFFIATSSIQNGKLTFAPDVMLKLMS